MMLINHFSPGSWRLMPHKDLTRDKSFHFFFNKFLSFNFLKFRLGGTVVKEVTSQVFFVCNFVIKHSASLHSIYRTKMHLLCPAAG